MYEVLSSYPRIKRAQVFDVPCVGDDPPVLVLDVVSPWSEHLVDDGDNMLTGEVTFEDRI
jgi:hypothetical protein